MGGSGFSGMSREDMTPQATSLKAQELCHAKGTLAPAPQAMTHPGQGMDLSKELDEAMRNALQYIFAYSVIWGLGGNLDRCGGGQRQVWEVRGPGHTAVVTQQM